MITILLHPLNVDKMDESLYIFLVSVSEEAAGFHGHSNANIYIPS